MDKLDELKRKQKRLETLFSALIQEKKKHEILTFGLKDGRIVKHYPDGKIETVGHAE